MAHKRLEQAAVTLKSLVFVDLTNNKCAERVTLSDSDGPLIDFFTGLFVQIIIINKNVTQSVPRLFKTTLKTPAPYAAPVDKQTEINEAES